MSPITFISVTPSVTAAQTDAEYTIRRMADIRNGDKPDECGQCEWCLSQKKIERFEVI